MAARVATDRRDITEEGSSFSDVSMPKASPSQEMLQSSSSDSSIGAAPGIQENMRRPGASAFEREAIATDPFATSYQRAALESSDASLSIPSPGARTSFTEGEVSQISMPSPSQPVPSESIDFQPPDSMHRMTPQGTEAPQGVMTSLGLLAPGRHELTGPESGHRANENVFQTVDIKPDQFQSQGGGDIFSSNNMFSSNGGSSSAGFGFDNLMGGKSHTLWDLSKGPSAILQMLGKFAKGVWDFIF